jgi:hypothetical protein
MSTEEANVIEGRIQTARKQPQQRVKVLVLTLINLKSVKSHFVRLDAEYKLRASTPNARNF